MRKKRRTAKQEQRWQKHKKMLDGVGWDGGALAAKLKITPMALYMRFYRMNVWFAKEKRKYMTTVKFLRADKLRMALRETGYNMTLLAKKLNIPKKVVQQRAARLGLRKETGDVTNYPARLKKDVVARFRTKAKEIKRQKGVEISLAEGVRVGLEFLAGLSEERIFQMCMRERSKNWRLRGRPKTGEDG